MKIKNILIVNTNAIYRLGLKCLLEKEQGLKVICEAKDGIAAVEMIRKDKPDILILDCLTEKLNCIDVIKTSAKTNPDIKIICISGFIDRDFLFRSIRAGASGFLVKESSYEELVFAIKAAVCGKKYITPFVTQHLTDIIIHGKDDETDVSSILTGRERQVLQLIAEGNKTREIASILYISSKTVEVHRKKIMEKLGIKNIALLTKYAISNGLTSECL